MSELINEISKRSHRQMLMATASAATLLSLMLVSVTQAGTADEKPTVWIEVGGQLDRVSEQTQPYAPPFVIVGQLHGLLPLQDLESTPHYSIGEEGSISFHPKNSDWSFSASIQYGRANNQSPHRHQEIPYTFVLANGLHQKINGPSLFQAIYQTSDYSVKTNDSHAIIDFRAGKDVGLGLWKSSQPSVISVGIRFAQFATRTKMNLHADPNPHLGNYGSVAGYAKYLNQYYQFYKAQPQIARSFSGLGPTISWNESLPIAETEGADTEITLDFAANAGVLIGRQKLQIDHQTTGDRYAVRLLAPQSGQPKYADDHYVNSSKMERSRTVVVPNIGGIAGLSLKFPNGKVSFGYRADFFFGAMDGGIDTPKTENQNFYGPFATISVGL